MAVEFSDGKGAKNKTFFRSQRLKKPLERHDLSVKKIIGTIKSSRLPDLRVIRSRVPQSRRQLRFTFRLNGEKTLQLIRQQQNPGFPCDSGIRSPIRQDLPLLRDQKESDLTAKRKRNTKSRSLKSLWALERQMCGLAIFFR